MDCRVIEIMNEFEIIINYGEFDNAQVGELVRIYTKGGSVIDPLDKRILGSLDIIKADLEIFRVYEEFSICRSIRRNKSRNLLNPIADILYSENGPYTPLDVDQKSITGRKSFDESPIVVGDLVRIL